MLIVEPDLEIPGIMANPCTIPMINAFVLEKLPIPASLLSDLARFNRTLLSAILESGQPRGVTYNSRGGTSRSGDVAFVNLEF